MDRKATKDHYEKETEEVERLVRPNPKVKPPRHDLRRETVEPSKDPDLDKPDKDLSKNFKDIGGSLSARIVQRWAKGPAPIKPVAPISPSGTSAKPAPPKPAGTSAQPPAASKPTGKRIKVRHKGTGKVVLVSPETLKETPGEYETIKNSPEKSKPGTPSAKQPGTSAQPNSPKSEAPKAAPVTKAPEPQKPQSGDFDEDKAYAAKDALKSLAETNPGLASVLQDLEKPSSDMYQLAEGNPKIPAANVLKDRLRGQALPEGIKTLGDLKKVLQLPPKAKGAKPKIQKKPKQKLQENAYNHIQDHDPNAPETELTDSDLEPVDDSETELQDSDLEQMPDDSEMELQDSDIEFEKPKGKGKSKGKPKGKKPPSIPKQPKFKPSTSYQAPPPENPVHRANRDELEPLLKKHPKLAEALRDIHKPNSQLGVDIAADPMLDVRKYFAGVVNPQEWPAEVQVMADLQNAMKLAPSKKNPKSKKNKGQATPAQSDALQTRATNLITSTFPPDVAGKVLGISPPLKPQEVDDLVRDYNTAKNITVKPKEIPELIQRASKFFSLDPKKVKNYPKTVQTDKGEAAFDSLDPKAKAAAMRKHQIKTVAMSLAASHAVSVNLQHTGAPPALAGSLSQFFLSTTTMPPGQRDEEGAKIANSVFKEALSQGKAFKGVGQSAFKKLLRAVQDPGARKIAVGYLQAQDYLTARRKYLDSSSKESLNEHQNPKDIAKRLGKATEFLRAQDAKYPPGSTTQDSLVFRDRVMKHLATLDPSRARAVQKLLDEQDNALYDKQLKEHGHKMKSFNKELHRAKQEFQKEYKQYTALVRKGENPDPPLSASERLKEKGIEAPQEPRKPHNYDATRKKPVDQQQDAANAWDQFSKTASADDAFSIYRDTFAMGNRKAVYWGIDPTKDSESYVGWQQPQSRDLGERDFTLLLKSAREWLKKPGLSMKIDGVLPDTQYRAALDLAIRTAGYESALHPELYNNLLARLAGVPENKTLLTVTATRKTMATNNEVKLTAAQADEILGRLDKMASTIEERHEKWGMPFKLAKELVNALDATADAFEGAAYGTESMLRRQASVLGFEKSAEVIEKESDESYMGTFDAPMKPKQTDGDEPYMQAYADDQSSAVRHGKSTSGRPLAKG